MPDILNRAELRAQGFRSRELTALVRAGSLIRARRDNYLPDGTSDEIIRAVRVGGRLTCLSLLSMLGVFVLSNDKLHVHVSVNAARLRSPHDRRRRLESRGRRGVRLHWHALSIDPGRSACTHLVDALAHAVQCQTPRAAVATLDSALHLGLITPDQVSEIFAQLPKRHSVLAGLLDARAESGPESLVRLMLRGLGCQFDLQVEMDGAGRVDIVVDGWLVIECDSVQHHSDKTSYFRDRRRDALLAAQGFATLRLTAHTIMYSPEVVIEAIRGLLASRSSA